MKSRHVVALVVLGVVSVTAYAAPVSYDEAVDGDLPVLSSLKVFNFDVGVNTITGEFGDLAPPDIDSFGFVVPAGRQVISVQVELADVQPDIDFSSWDLYSGSTDSTGTFLEDLTSLSPGSADLSAVPLGPGSYAVVHDEYVFSNNGARSSYVFTFNVIPEPATAVMGGFGLVGLVMWCRRGGRGGV